MLTDTQVRQAKARDKGYKLSDRNGLFLYVTPKAYKSWRYKYRQGGKEQTLTFGTYPEMSLADAREHLEAARKQRREGRDPKLEFNRKRIVGGHDGEITFEQMAAEWHDSRKDGWSDVHAADVLRSMERDLFADLGGMPLSMIDRQLLLAVLHKVEMRGAIETALRLRQRAEQVFDYAISTGRAENNPAVKLHVAMKKKPKHKPMPALTTVEEVKILIRYVDRAGASPVTRLAARFLALTSQRPGMVRHMEWEDLRNIDWSNPDADVSEAIWHVPADKMKLEKDQKEDDAFDHLVPLSAHAVETLRVVRILTARCRYVFPNARSGQKPMTENAIGYLYNRQGYKKRHVPHGWRSSFSTIMNGFAERNLELNARQLADRLIIDIMLAHVPTGISASEFRYNRAGYMERRRELFEDWAERIMQGAMQPMNIIDSPRRIAKAV